MYLTDIIIKLIEYKIQFTFKIPLIIPLIKARRRTQKFILNKKRDLLCFLKNCLKK
jgi:hypothetical protein